MDKRAAAFFSWEIKVFYWIERLKEKRKAVRKILWQGIFS